MPDPADGWLSCCRACADAASRRSAFMTRLDDGTLVAFVEGELDAAAMHRVAEAIKHDPEAAEKVRLLRLSATLVGAAFREPRHLQVSRN